MMHPPTLSPTHLSMLEETLVGVREQPQLGVRVEEMPQDSKGPSNVSSRPRRAASSPKMNVASQTPIPLPSTRWEDIPESPTSLTPISKMEARVSQQPRRVSQEPERGPDQGPVATVGSNLEILLPTLLEIESMEDEASKVEKIKDELGAFAPSPRYLAVVMILSAWCPQGGRGLTPSFLTSLWALSIE